MDNILDLTNKYSEAPNTLPKKDLITTKNDKVQLRMRIQSRDKLAKDVDKFISSYNHLLSGLYRWPKSITRLPSGH